MRVRYTLGARADLDAIHAYLNERNPHAAQKVIATIHERIAGLADWPYRAAGNGGRERSRPLRRPISL